MSGRLLAAATCGLALCISAPAQAEPAPESVRHATFDNGLEVLVWPDRDLPTVAMYLWYRVGSRDEGPGRTGVSHFFEHMMFNGAKKYGPGEFDRVMEGAGGFNNAFTSPDVTVYQNWFPPEAMDTVLDLEQDRIRDLSFDPKMVESERGVVYSERRTAVDDNPPALLDEQTRATAFLAHPYGIPTIGWPSDIESWSQADLQRHFETYYAPNNAVVVLTGDVDPDAVIARLKATFGTLPRGPEAQPVRTVEPEQRGQRRLVLERGAAVPVLQMSFHAPRPTDPDFVTWEVLQALLSHGESSRLYRRLVDEERLCIEVDVELDDGFDPGLLSIRATLVPGADAAAVEGVVWEELGRLAETGPTAAELAKARRQQRVDLVRMLETINGRAYMLGHFHLFRGGWRHLFSAPEAFDSVRAEAVAQVAAERLTPSRATVAVLLPTAPEEVSDESR
jgi:zinc protease